MSRKTVLMALALLPAACSREAAAPTDNISSIAPAAAPVPAAAPSPRAETRPDYVGRWTGVEGMVLDVLPGKTPNLYRLTMQYDLDHKGSVDATRDGDTLVFDRDGERKVLRPTDGDATGLKYLAGKKDCLTVAAGEGYCRD